MAGQSKVMRTSTSDVPAAQIAPNGTNDTMGTTPWWFLTPGNHGPKAMDVSGLLVVYPIFLVCLVAGILGIRERQLLWIKAIAHICAPICRYTQN